MARRPIERLYEITEMREGDIDAVMAIERLSFRAPWERKIFSDEIDREFAHVDLLRARAKPDHVLGFVNYWLVHDEVHLLNLAIDPASRRSGHGARLLEHVIAYAHKKRGKLITLEVRRSNTAARRLYRKYGFRPIGVRPHYYENREDAIVMLLEI